MGHTMEPGSVIAAVHRRGREHVTMRNINSSATVSHSLCWSPLLLPQGRYRKGSWHCLSVQREGDGEFRLLLRGWALGAIAGFFLDKYMIKTIF